MVFSLLKSKFRKKQEAGRVPPEVSSGERSSNPQVCIKLAEHFLRESKPDQAVDEYLNAAQAFLEKRQTQLAMAVYRNILTIDPDRYSVYETLADLYAKSGFHGDGASVLLALAFQYEKVGYDSEVKHVLDRVLELAPDNPALKRKVESFCAGRNKPAAPASEPGAAAVQGETAQASEPERASDVVASQPDISIHVEAPASEPVAAAEPDETAQESEPEKPSGTPETQVDAPAPEPDAAAVQEEPEQAVDPDLSSGLFELQADIPVQEEASTPEPDAAAVQEEPEQAVEPEQQPDVSETQKGVSAQESVPEATARSFFDLQEALATDASLGFDHDSTAEHVLENEQGSSSFSVLNVVKNIALQDDSQDTPLFHFNLGVGYMQCGEYEQAVDELLNALYGVPDRIGCYVRLAECSLHLQRRELASGFLREALACPGISPEKAENIQKRLDAIVAD